MHVVRVVHLGQVVEGAALKVWGVVQQMAVPDGSEKWAARVQGAVCMWVAAKKLGQGLGLWGGEQPALAAACPPVRTNLAAALDAGHLPQSRPRTCLG